MIKIDKIDFSYNDTKVLDELSLEISSGKWVGLIGPNGAGKTTLVRMIAGALDAESGTINIDNRDLKSYSRREIAQIIAVVPQVEPFPFAFTALEIVLMGRSPYMKPFGFETEVDFKIAKDSMLKTDTWGFRDRPIDELSGGERQRVLIARALTQEPKILLLDEPTTFLDIKHQVDIMEIVAELNKQGLTVVSAIHDINLAISYCTEITLLNNGKIFKSGKPEEIITYANLKDIFKTDVYVGVNEFTKKPYYVPMQSKPRSP